MSEQNSTNAYIVFWIAVIPIVALAMIFSEPIEIQAPISIDIYIPINLALAAAIYLLLSGMGYYYFRRTGMNRLLEKIHVWISLITLFGAPLYWKISGTSENGNDLVSLVILGMAISVTSYLINLAITGFERFLSSDSSDN